jgi:hypothetical protein
MESFLWTTPVIFLGTRNHERRIDEGRAANPTVLDPTAAWIRAPYQFSHPSRPIQSHAGLVGELLIVGQRGTGKKKATGHKRQRRSLRYLPTPVARNFHTYLSRSQLVPL